MSEKMLNSKDLTADTSIRDIAKDGKKKHISEDKDVTAFVAKADVSDEEDIPEKKKRSVGETLVLIVVLFLAAIFAGFLISRARIYVEKKNSVPQTAENAVSTDESAGESVDGELNEAELIEP